MIYACHLSLLVMAGRHSILQLAPYYFPSHRIIYFLAQSASRCTVRVPKEEGYTRFGLGWQLCCCTHRAMFFFSCGLPDLLFATVLCMSGLTGNIGRHESALVRFLITQGHSTISLCRIQIAVCDFCAISSTSFISSMVLRVSFNNHLCTQLSLNEVMYPQHLSHWTDKANA